MSNVVEAECLTRRFGDLIALDAVSFSLEAGKIYGLLGRNGSGKTTLLRLLTAQLFATSGSLLVFGEQPYENRPVLSQICFLKESQPNPKRWRVGDVLNLSVLGRGLCRRVEQRFSAAVDAGVHRKVEER